MGGNALAAQGARRVDAPVAFSMASDLTRRLTSIVQDVGGELRCELVKAYRDKTSFGDLDVVIDSKVYDKLTPASLLAGLEHSYGQSLPFVKNGPVLSVGLPLSDGSYLQADLISQPSESYDSALAYFAWNDLGNLVGRIAHKMGLKFGHDGLWLPLRDGTNLFDSVLLSRDIGEILSFLGYDAEVWKAGFDNVEQIYRFTASTPYFNRDIYELDNRNHTARVREKKRPVYMEFVEWTKNPPMELSRFQWNPEKSTYLPVVFEAFPQAKIAYDEAVARLEDSKYRKGRFNGQVVSSITGLVNSDLGQFMAYFNKNHRSELDNLREMSDEQINSVISSAYGVFKATSV